MGWKRTALRNHTGYGRVERGNADIARGGRTKGRKGPGKAGP